MKKTTHVLYKSIGLLLLISALGLPAHAQNLLLEHESLPRHRLAMKGPDLVGVSERHRFDLTGDGIPDVVMTRTDEQGAPVEILVIDMASRTPIWSMSYQALTTTLGGDDRIAFLGFFDFDGSGTKKAVFRSRDALAIIGILVGKHSAAGPFVLIASSAIVLDIDGDSLPEIILQNPDTKTVQVWGSGDTGTATEDEIEATLNRLFQNYPNPFETSTTIAYDVWQAGPVTLTVYDILGRTVRQLVDRDQPVGVHHAAWDGRDDAGRPVAAGTYFYRLRVGDSVSSKQTIRIR